MSPPAIFLKGLNHGEYIGMERAYIKTDLLNHSILKAKKVEKCQTKRFQPAFGCVQHPKAGLNTQQVFILHIILQIRAWLTSI